MNQEILRAQITDIPVLCKMMKDFYAIDHYPFNENLLLRDDFETFAIFVIFNKYFSFEFGGEILFLDELYIKPEYQGKSLGKKSLEFVKDYSAEKKFPVVLLEIENHNEKAKKLYEHYGFQKHKRSLMILKN